MTQTTDPSGALPAPAAASVAEALAGLAGLAGAPEALLVLVDEQGRIVDVRRAAPAFLAANLVTAAPDRPDQSQEGDSGCLNDVGHYPWLSD